MQIWPSLLAANLLELSSQIQILIDHDLEQVHLDIMDNHYVPNLSFGPDLCWQIHQKFPQLSIDVHLMTQPAHELAHKFIAAGAKRIAIHANLGPHMDFYLQSIKAKDCQVGLALNPGEDFKSLHYLIPQIDYILLMTVNPGFGGQKLIPYTVNKLKSLRQAYPQLPIMVDGGVNLTNIKSLLTAGATDVVIGSALFQARDFPQCIIDFQHAAQVNA
jgi:ribulose-phosphate 3-epimerase